MAESAAVPGLLRDLARDVLRAAGRVEIAGRVLPDDAADYRERQADLQHRTQSNVYYSPCCAGARETSRA